MLWARTLEQLWPWLTPSYAWNAVAQFVAHERVQPRWLTCTILLQVVVFVAVLLSTHRGMPMPTRLKWVMATLMIAANYFAYYQVFKPNAHVVWAFFSGIDEAAHGLVPRRTIAERKCVVCLSKRPTLAFSCGAVRHACVCVNCAARLLGARCPVCRVGTTIEALT